MPRLPYLSLANQNIAAASGVAIFFLADRFLKATALQMRPDPAWPLLGKMLTFQFTANYNIAFSLPLGGPWLNWLIAAVITTLIIYLIRLWSQPDNRLVVVALILIIAGALSNLIDRLTYGYVVDYLELRYFTVFNLADIMISLGAITLIIKSLRAK